MNTKLSRWCDGFLEAGWLIALITTPLFFNIHSDRVFEPDKLTLLRSIALVMSLVWMAKFIDQQGWRDLSWLKWNSPNSIWRMPLVLPVLGIVVIYMISTLGSVAPRTSFWGSYQRLQGTYTTLSYIIIFAIVAATLRTREQVQRLITTVIIVSIPVSVYGILQHYKLDSLPWGGDTSTRVAGHMGNAIFVAAYLVMALPLTAVRIVDSIVRILSDEELSYADVVRSSIYILTVILQLLTINWTQSRGPILGLGFGMFAFILVLLVGLRNSASADKKSSVPSFLWPLIYFVILVATPFIANLSFRGNGTASFLLFGAIAVTLVLSIFILAALRKGLTWLWMAWLVVTLGIGSILGYYNIVVEQLKDQAPNEILLGEMFDEWYKLPTIGRLGEMLDSEGGTSQVRLLIWEGALNLISPHEPIFSPDGTRDQLNFLRPLIGYGPESMYVAYNRFYPPELATVEARNASPDRSHNETFDAFVITGLLGFIAWQIFYVSLFYHGFRAVNVVKSKSDRNILYALWFLGALIATAIIGSLRGMVYMGVSIPFGSMLGLVVYLIYYGVKYSAESTTHSENDDAQNPQKLFSLDNLIGVGLLAALIAYYIEIHFGIAIAATRLHSFVYAGVILVLAHYGFSAEKAAEHEPQIAEGITPPTIGRRARDKNKSSRSLPSFNYGAVIAGLFILTTALGTLGYDFINYTPRPGVQIRTLADIPAAGAIFKDALFTNPRAGFASSPYLFGVIVMTWLFGAILLVAEMIKSGVLSPAKTQSAEKQKMLTGAGIYALLGIMGLAAYWVGQSADAASNATRIGGLLGLLWGIISLALAGGLAMGANQESLNPTARLFAGFMAVIGLLFAIPLFVAGAWQFAVLIAIGCAVILVVLWDASWNTIATPLLIIGVVALLGGLLYTLIHVGNLRTATFIAPNANLYTTQIQRRVIEAERVSSYLYYFYGFVLSMGLLIGTGLSWFKMSAERNSATLMGSIALMVALILGGYLTITTNLNIIAADMTYKRGKPFDQQAAQLTNQAANGETTAEDRQKLLEAAVENWNTSAAVYERTVEMSPNEDFYYLWLGRSYLEQSRINAGQTIQLLETAEKRLLRAQQINPLNTDHTANLARLNTRWADVVRSDEQARKERSDKAANYYQIAMKLSPQNSLIRNEYAGLQLTVQNDCDGAIATFKEGLELDPYYGEIYLRLSDTYIRCATQPDPATPKLDYYQAASETMETGLETMRPISARTGFANTTAQIQLRVAQGYQAAGKIDLALTSAETALTHANETFAPQVQTLIDQLKGTAPQP